MNPEAEALKRRTHDFFIRVIKLCEALTASQAGSSISGQLIDAAGSADGNYGAACKGRTSKLFVDKICLAAEEADESMRWLEALRDAGLGDRAEVVSLIDEANQLTAIFVASHNTAKHNLEEAERRKAAERAARKRTRRRPSTDPPSPRLRRG
jgi:four helix bundle protein